MNCSAVSQNTDYKLGTIKENSKILNGVAKYSTKNYFTSAPLRSAANAFFLTPTHLELNLLAIIHKYQ